MSSKKESETSSGSVNAITSVKVISGRRITLPEAMCTEYDLHEGSRVTLLRQPAGWLITTGVLSQAEFKTNTGVTVEVSLPQ
ncbi:MAG: AbrB/MazE/SpoVT family DNA-binding domain-containing protein [Thermoplasmata archaeon]